MAFNLDVCISSIPNMLEMMAAFNFTPIIWYGSKHFQQGTMVVHMAHGLSCKDLLDNPYLSMYKSITLYAIRISFLAIVRNYFYSSLICMSFLICSQISQFSIQERVVSMLPMILCYLWFFFLIFLFWCFVGKLYIWFEVLYSNNNDGHPQACFFYVSS